MEEAEAFVEAVTAAAVWEWVWVGLKAWRWEDFGRHYACFLHDVELSCLRRDLQAWNQA